MENNPPVLHLELFLSGIQLALNPLQCIGCLVCSCTTCSASRFASSSLFLLFLPSFPLPPVVSVLHSSGVCPWSSAKIFI